MTDTLREALEAILLETIGPQMYARSGTAIVWSSTEAVNRILAALAAPPVVEGEVGEMVKRLRDAATPTKSGILPTRKLYAEAAGLLSRIAGEKGGGADKWAILRRANTERQLAWADGVDPGLMFHAVELGGEAGELLNVVKKIERERNGWRGSRATKQDLADELADVIICADKLAGSQDIDLWEAVVAKFNATSEKVGLPHRLALSKPAGLGVEEIEKAAYKRGWTDRETAP